MVENTALWCIWDNFQLTYYGASATIDEVEKDAATKVYKEALAKAKAVDTEATMDPTALKGITDALANYTEDKVLKDGATVESINAAATALNSAAEAATKSIANAVALMSMNDLMESTNVYTKGAYEAYKKICDDYTAAWNAGTLTEAVINPYATQGWHSANVYDDLLLSAWSVGENPCKDFDTPLYINTWSVEGDNDGTNFKVPFFEYWTSDANSLGETTMESTMTDLDANREYSLDIWARVRQTNGQTKGEDKITIQLSNGSAVDLAAGTQVGSSQFYLKHFRAYGKTDASGNLTITITVANDSKVSWLSFKDMMLKPKADVIVSAKAGKYGTVILPFTYNFKGDEDFSNITFYSCASVNNSYTQIEEVSTPEANTPYIIKNNGESDFSKTISGFSVAEESSYTVGLLTGVYTNADIPVSDASYSYYVLQTHDDGVQAFYKVDAALTATAYKCYLKVPVTTPPVKAFKFDIFDAINAIEAEQNEKTEIFNLAGQRMSKVQKGVNIINGKKVLVK